MVTGTYTTVDKDFWITAKPNCSLTPRGRLWLFVVIAMFSLLVAVGFALVGAWMVFPFAGLELMALGAAFYVVHCHSNDYESITIAGDDLAVETRNYKNINRIVFHRYWARVVMRDTPGGEQRLWLRSHGKEVEFGRYIDNDTRLMIARELKQRVGAIY